MSAAATPSLRKPEAAGRDYRNLGRAWVALCAAFALHVLDEATTGFLDIYNPTAAELQRRLGVGFPPVFAYRDWLFGLITGVVVLLALSPFAFRGSRWLRPLAYVYAIIMILNACGHTAGTIAGRGLFPWITFPRPMPGFYSSPTMLAASVWLFIALRRTRPA